MTEVYMICMIAGLLIPFFSIVCSLFDGFLDISFDFFDFDIGDVTIDFLPISINSLCMASLLFGGIGLSISSNNGSYTVANAVGGIVGYIGAVSVQTLIKHMRKKQTLADTQDMMLARTGRVVTSIKPNSFGSVLLSIEGSSDIQYTAKNIDSIKLTTSDTVEVVEFVDGIANIKKKVSIVDKYSKE